MAPVCPRQSQPPHPPGLRVFKVTVEANGSLDPATESSPLPIMRDPSHNAHSRYADALAGQCSRLHPLICYHSGPAIGPTPPAFHDSSHIGPCSAALRLDLSRTSRPSRSIRQRFSPDPTAPPLRLFSPARCFQNLRSPILSILARLSALSKGCTARCVTPGGL